jgi:ribonuclease VapC
MVIDTSVLAAILFLEPERKTFIEKMAAAPWLHLSAASLVEITAVLLRRGPDDVEGRLDEVLDRAGVIVIPVDESQAAIAREAYRKYGRGRHPASLNLGDCFPYALAVRTDDVLLFKGNDFNQTDVGIA